MRVMKNIFKVVVFAVVIAFAGCTDTELNYNYNPTLNCSYLSSPSNLSFSAAKSSQPLTVTAGQNSWDINSSVKWVSVDPSSGTGRKDVTISVEENFSADTARVGVLDVVSVDGQWKNTNSISISQGRAQAYITPDITSETVPGAASSLTIGVKANTDWSMSSNASWATGSVSSDKSNITLSFEENTTGVSRIATFTLQSNLASTAITITQRAANINVTQETQKYGNHEDTHFIDIESEARWTANTSAGWIVISPISGTAGKTRFGITALENKAPNTRKDYVYISIDGKNKIEIPVEQTGVNMVVNPETLNFPSTASYSSISITANTGWNVASLPEWASVDQKSGKDNGTIKISVQDNPAVSFLDREGDLVINNEFGTLTRKVHLLQAGKEFDINTQILTFDDKAGSQSVNVTTEGTWTAIANQEWITVDPSTKTGNGTLTISVKENTTTEERGGEVNVTVADKTIKIVVTQKSKYINIDTEALNFEAKGGTTSVSVGTNYSWTIEKDAEWLEVSPVSGNGNVNLNITAEENFTTEQRTGKVMLVCKNAKTYVMTVTQKGKYFQVSPDNLTFTSKAGNKTFSITTDYDYTISVESGATWLMSTVKKGSGDAIVTAAVTENKSGDDRSAKLLIACENAKTYEVTVTQSGVELTLDKSEVVIDADGGTQIVTVTTDATFAVSKTGNWFGYTISGNKISILASGNTGEDREGTLTVKLTNLPSGSRSVTIPVKQSDGRVVDLGLSVKWASMNIGAKSPEEYGGSYAWGEVSTKDIYSSDTYTYKDNPKVLPLEHDVANVRWGGSWRMPTMDETNEFISNCVFTWTTNYNNSGINGYVVKSKINGNTIFLPAAGYNRSNEIDEENSGSHYWSSTLCPYNSDYAYSIESYMTNSFTLHYSNRHLGYSVRAVCP